MKKRFDHNNGGYTMLMVLMLITLLLGAFMFFGDQLSGNIEAHDNTRVDRNKEAYLDSFKDFVKHYVNDIGDDAGYRFFRDINYRLTKQVSTIEGYLSSGETATYGFTGNIQLEWNLCADNQKGDLLFTDNDTNTETLYSHDDLPAGECGPGEEGYDDVQTITTTATYIIKAVNAPFYYRIINPDSNVNAGLITDNKWHFDAKTIGYDNKPIAVSETF